jgi:hypothetical protein
LTLIPKSVTSENKQHLPPTRDHARARRQVLYCSRAITRIGYSVTRIPGKFNGFAG